MTENTQAVEQHRSTGALAIQPDQTEFTEQQRAALAQIGVGNASRGDLAVFLTYAQRTGLDPWTRQLFMIARGGKWTIQASIDGLRIVAQRSGDYAGQVGPEWCGQDGQWRDVWLEATPPAAARVGVLRRGWAQPQYAVALFREYSAGNSMWREKPALMLAKCAEALALRKAFPHDLSGVYTGDELSRADSVPGEVVIEPVRAPQEPARAPQAAPQARQAPAQPSPEAQAQRARELAVRALEQTDAEAVTKARVWALSHGLGDVDAYGALDATDLAELPVASDQPFKYALSDLLADVAEYIRSHEAAVRWERLQAPAEPDEADVQDAVLL